MSKNPRSPSFSQILQVPRPSAITSTRGTFSNLTIVEVTDSSLSAATTEQDVVETIDAMVHARAEQFTIVQREAIAAKNARHRDLLGVILALGGVALYVFSPATPGNRAIMASVALCIVAAGMFGYKRLWLKGPLVEAKVETDPEPPRPAPRPPNRGSSKKKKQQSRRR